QSPEANAGGESGDRRTFMKGAALMGAGVVAGMAATGQAQAQQPPSVLLPKAGIKEKIAAARLEVQQKERIASNAITMEALKIAETLGGPGKAAIFSLSFGLRF